MSICDTGCDRKQYFGKHLRRIQKNMSRSFLSLSQDLSIKNSHPFMHIAKVYGIIFRGEHKYRRGKSRWVTLWASTSPPPCPNGNLRHLESLRKPLKFSSFKYWCVMIIKTFTCLFKISSIESLVSTVCNLQKSLNTSSIRSVFSKLVDGATSGANHIS